MRTEGFSQEEQVQIDKLPDKNQVALSLIANVLTVASLYSKLEVPVKPISQIVVTSLIGRPVYILKNIGIQGAHKEERINRPVNIPGPVSNFKNPPLLSQLIDGIISDHVPQDKYVPLESIANDLRTGLYKLTS